MSIFQSFRSTVNGFVRGAKAADFNVLADPVTGSPVGLQHRNGSGPDGIWAPIDVTSAQIVSPTAAMLADLNAVYRLNVAPYTRYYSNGSALVSSAGDDSGVTNILTANPPGFNDGQDVFTTASITASAYSLTVTDSLFALTDVGKTIGIIGAGTAAGILLTTVASYVSPTNITISNAAITTISAAPNTRIMWGTDNTTAIQTAVTAIGASSSRSGIIFFPDGLYMVSGAFQTFPAGAGAVGKSLILLPNHPATTGPINVTLIGDSPPPYGGYSVIGAQTVSKQGSIIMTLKGDTSGAPSIIGGAGNTGGYPFTSVLLGLKNLTFRTYNNPAIMPVDAQYIGSLQCENTNADIGSNISDTLVPTNADAIAFATPLNNNGAFTYFRNCNVVGYYVGFQWNEHTDASNCDTYICRTGHFINTANHAMRFGRLGSFHSIRDVEFQNFGGVAAVSIQQLDIEIITTTGFANEYNISDPANAGYGDISWHVVQANVGPVNRFVVNGGSHLKLQQLISPSTPLGTIEGPNGMFGKMIVYAPLTVTAAQPLTVRGTVSVRNLPA